MVLLKLDEVIMVHMVAVIVCSSRHSFLLVSTGSEIKSASSEYLIRTL